MGVRISSHNHCESKLNWDEEYPMYYLFSTSDNNKKNQSEDSSHSDSSCKDSNESGTTQKSSSEK